MQNQSACIGPNRGPVQAKMAENACMGRENGPVRAPKEKIGRGTAPTLNRSTLSEAKAASAARPARVFADVGGKYGKGLRPQGGRGNPIPPYEKGRPAVAPVRGR